MWENYHIRNPARYRCENGQYLASSIDDSVITCDEIKEEAKAVTTNFNEKLQSVKISIIDSC